MIRRSRAPAEPRSGANRSRMRHDGSAERRLRDRARRCRLSVARSGGLGRTAGLDRPLDSDGSVRKGDGRIRQRDCENLKAASAAPPSASPHTRTNHVADENGDVSNLEMSDREDHVIDEGSGDGRSESGGAGDRERHNPRRHLGRRFNVGTATVAQDPGVDVEVFRLDRLPAGLARHCDAGRTSGLGDVSQRTVELQFLVFARCAPARVAAGGRRRTGRWRAGGSRTRPTGRIQAR